MPKPHDFGAQCLNAGIDRKAFASQIANENELGQQAERFFEQRAQLRKPTGAGCRRDLVRYAVQFGPPAMRLPFNAHFETRPPDRSIVEPNSSDFRPDCGLLAERSVQFFA